MISEEGRQFWRRSILRTTLRLDGDPCTVSLYVDGHYFAVTSEWDATTGTITATSRCLSDPPVMHIDKITGIVPDRNDMFICKAVDSLREVGMFTPASAARVAAQG